MLGEYDLQTIAQKNLEKTQLTLTLGVADSPKC